MNHESSLWSDVDALLRRARRGDARMPGPPAAKLPADPFAR
jgi:hypothetical protein